MNYEVRGPLPNPHRDGPFDARPNDIDVPLAKHAKADERQVGGTHYKDMPMQPWDVMEAVLTPEEFRGFLKGNIIKYNMRAGRKIGSQDDAPKAAHYAQKLKEVRWL
jgi:hypothetical protein